MDKIWGFFQRQCEHQWGAKNEQGENLQKAVAYKLKAADLNRPTSQAWQDFTTTHHFFHLNIYKLSPSQLYTSKLCQL